VAPLAGDCPMPMQGPQPASRMRAPDSMSACSAPLSAIIARAWRLPGLMVSETLGATT